MNEPCGVAKVLPAWPSWATDMSAGAAEEWASLSMIAAALSPAWELISSFMSRPLLVSVAISPPAPEISALIQTT